MLLFGRQSGLVHFFRVLGSQGIFFAVFRSVSTYPLMIFGAGYALRRKGWDSLVRWRTSDEDRARA